MVTFYKNGQDFYNENKNIINENEIQTPFLKLNALSIENFDCYNYCIKITNDDKYLLCVSKYPYSMLIFGDIELIPELANIIFISNLKYSQILAMNDLTLKFIEETNKLIDYKFTTINDMDLLIYETPNNISCSYQQGTLEDIDQISELFDLFQQEVFGEYFNGCINPEEFYFIKENDKIISILKKTRELEQSVSLSIVYTREEYRNLGYCQRLVSSVSNDLLKSGKKVLLFVDRNNPISNHLYLKVGFKPLLHFLEVHKTPGNIKKTILAGGCFWCISDSYYDIEGVIEVYSGFALGNTFFPTYEEVKSQKTHHKEAIYVIYDSSKVSYEKLINIYFENIDPFDGDGQYMDRGESYQTGVITSCAKEIDYFYKVKECIESRTQKEVKVQLFKDTVFYIAEEYHQKYSIKNPEEFLKEMKESGRIKD